MDKLTVFLGYCLAGLIGGVAVFVFTTVTLGWSFDDGLSLAIGWLSCMLMGTAIQTLVEHGRVGHTIGIFLGDLLRGLRGQDGGDDGDFEPEDEIAAPMQEPVDRNKLESALRVLVERYHAGERISRKACLDAGVVDQRYWNLANGILTELGFRDGMEFKSLGSLEDDLGAVLRGFLLVGHGKKVYAKQPDGETREIAWAG